MCVYNSDTAAPCLLPPQVPATDRNALNSLWGKLASEILMQNWEAAMEDLTRLRETIDNNVNAPTSQNLIPRLDSLTWTLVLTFRLQHSPAVAFYSLPTSPHLTI